MRLQSLCWPERAVTGFGRAEEMVLALRDLEAVLNRESPVVYEIEGSYLVVVRAGRNLRVLRPDLSEHSVSAAAVAAAIRRPFEAQYRAGYESIGPLSGKAVAALLREQTAGVRFRCWKFPEAQRQAKIWRGVLPLVAAHSLQYVLWLASWGVLGSLSFSGHMDRGWLLAWALLLVTLIPFRLLTTWLQGTFAIRLGRMLKRRLLQGALGLSPEEVRTGGVGSFLGQALEAEAIEALAISGGLAGLLAMVELVPAMLLLGRFAVVLVCWSAGAVFLAWRFLGSYQSWTGKRMELTGHLVEVLAGNRTRLAQQRRGDWHVLEDGALAGYGGVSAEVDRRGSWLVAAVPRGWLVMGLVCVVCSASPAVVLGGVLLAFSAFQRMVVSFADVAGAITGWQRIAPLLRRPIANRPQVDNLPYAAASSRLVEAERLVFRYQGQAVPALRGCDLSIRRGEKILLCGPSGGGKTTLASILAGLRKPDSGLLLINGLDRHTLGEAAWRKQVAVVPQFHENHILTGTLAFNLLMGREDDDIEEAEAVCRQIGLGDLLARMPGGVMQMVGDGGWQLSHGERSRVFLARALLQRAELVILDESFAALDPGNLRLAMETTLRRAETLLVIAHP